MEYFIAMGSDRRGPFRPEDLTSQGLRPDTLVWRDGMSQWMHADQVEELRGLFGPPQAPPPPGAGPMPGIPQPPPMQPGYYNGAPPFNKNEVNSKKIAAGLCGILIGGLGVHKFILGFPVAGIVTILISILTCGTAGSLIGLIEGIIYLTKSDEEFYQTYIVEKKSWF